MSTNPNAARITDAMWWLWTQLHELEPETELGGIYANKSGYHNTRNANRASWPGNYSVREAEDQSGPADKAAAIDWTFPSAQRGDYRRIALYSGRLLAAGKSHDPRMAGWREFYGQSDSDAHVEGWDFRHGVAVTSDSSHLWHIHLSEDRDQLASHENKDRLLSVLRGEPLEAWQARTGGLVVVPVVLPVPESAKGGHRPGSRTIRRGDKGEDVAFVQRWIGPARAGAADGDFGPHTEAGVRWYPPMRRITADGIVGPHTWHQMGV